MNNNETIDELKNMADNRKVDTLLECLLFLSKYYEREASADSLTSGLAIYDSLMTPKMFVESAKRVGLEIKTVQRELKDISKVALPSVITLNDNTACVLVDIDFIKHNAKVIMPSVSDGETTLSLGELEKLYNGFTMLIKPKYNFNNKIKRDVVIEKPKSGFGEL